MTKNKIEDNRFKKLPTHEELHEMKRDLGFIPVQAEQLSKFTSDQIETFNAEGYLKGIGIYNTEEISDIRTQFDDLLDRVIASGKSSYSIISAHLRSGMVHDIMNDTRIVDYVGDILGDDIVAWGSHFFCKMPKDGKIVAWHQDASYWPLSPSKTVTVWLAIDDADTENACMRFIAGSHKFGHIGYRPSDEKEQNVLNQTVEDPLQYGTPVDDDLKAGEISLHSDLLLHGSDANNSDRRRCGLTLRYCAAEVRAKMGWNKESTIIRGADPSGHWANQPRPAEDIV